MSNAIKVTQYTKTYETLKSHAKKQSMKANEKMTYMLELPDKDIKAATTKFLKRKGCKHLLKKYLKWKVSKWRYEEKPNGYFRYETYNK